MTFVENNYDNNYSLLECSRSGKTLLTIGK
jgi:hypothetical protein